MKPFLDNLPPARVDAKSVMTARAPLPAPAPDGPMAPKRMPPAQSLSSGMMTVLLQMQGAQLAS